jgi:hypothetical protein
MSWLFDWVCLIPFEKVYKSKLNKWKLIIQSPSLEYFPMGGK